MDLGFKMAPLGCDLSWVQGHNEALINRPELLISTASTEFQTVMDGFSAMKVKETKLRENERTKYVEENEDVEQRLRRRRNLTELTLGDAVSEFSQYPQKERRKSLPSLGLVAVDIQYSIPTKTNSRSELHSISKIPGKGAKPGDLKSATKALKLTNQVKEGSSYIPRRRFSLGAQVDMKGLNTPSGLATKQSRASCTRKRENNSAWRVKLHHWSVDIDDDSDNSKPQIHHVKTRRCSSLPISSSFTCQPANGRYGILPKINRKNSLVGARQKNCSI